MPPQACPSFPISWQVCLKTVKIVLIACNTYKIGKWIVNLPCHFHLTKTEITWNVIFSGLFQSLSVPVCVWWISIISLFSWDSWHWELRKGRWFWTTDATLLTLFVSLNHHELEDQFTGNDKWNSKHLPVSLFFFLSLEVIFILITENTNIFSHYCKDVKPQ